MEGRTKRRAPESRDISFYLSLPLSLIPMPTIEVHRRYKRALPNFHPQAVMLPICPPPPRAVGRSRIPCGSLGLRTLGKPGHAAFSANVIAVAHNYRDIIAYHEFYILARRFLRGERGRAPYCRGGMLFLFSCFVFGCQA